MRIKIVLSCIFLAAASLAKASDIEGYWKFTGLHCKSGFVDKQAAVIAQMQADRLAIVTFSEGKGVVIWQSGRDCKGITTFDYTSTENSIEAKHMLSHPLSGSCGFLEENYPDRKIPFTFIGQDLELGSTTDPKYFCKEVTDVVIYTFKRISQDEFEVRSKTYAP